MTCGHDDSTINIVMGIIIIIIIIGRGCFYRVSHADIYCLVQRFSKVG